jgi:ATP-dependent RNA helicase DeaD
VLYQLPHDWASIAHFLGPVLERVDESVPDVQLLIITADAEAAAAIAASTVRLATSRKLVPLAATSARRAARLLRARPAQIVAGTPEELLSLVQGATLKLEHLRAIVLAWVDEIAGAGGDSSLETLLADAPKETARIVVASAITPTVETLVERYARRARRVGVAAASTDAPIAVGYVTVTDATRLNALRRILDELDPPTALVYVRSDESEREVRDALRALGYGDDVVRVSRAGGAEAIDLVVVFDLPATREELREAVGAQPGRVIAMVLPRQLVSLTTLTGGGALTPVTLSEAGSRARHRETAVRAELSAILSSGNFARELLALEPLLDEYDGIEIAAATLQLLERARATNRSAAESHTAPRAAAAASAVATVRLFVNVGGMDNVRPGDLVGAIVNETGVPRETIGRVEIRDTHSLVEVSASQADDIAAKLTGTAIRGRRVQARVDQDRSLRPRREARADRPERGGRPEPRGEGRPPRRDERGPRGFKERGDRSGGRGERNEGRRTDRRGPRRGNDAEPRHDSRWERE